MKPLFKLLWESEMLKIKETHFLWGWPKTEKNIHFLDNLHTHIDTLTSFEVLNTNHTPIFNYLEKFPAVHEQKRFLSLTLSMAHRLNVKNLFLCTLFQNSGLYALAQFLENQSPDPHHRLKAHLLFELHPLISGLMSEKKGNPDEVTSTIIHHHDNPNSDTTSLLATLKALNWLADITPSVTLDLCKKAIEKLDQIPLRAFDLFDAWKESFKNLGKNSLQ